MGVETAIIAASLAATAFSAYSTVQSGKQASLNADAQSEQAQLDADNAASAAVVQADRIRRLARNQAGEANASLAASGVEVGAGTAVNINEDIIGNAEEDAAMTIFNGQNQKKRGYVDASNIALNGSQAQSSANSQAASSVLAGGSSAYFGWKAATRNASVPKQGGNG